VYRPKDRVTEPLFQELFPFGGRLDKNNRWLRISQLIPWDQLENFYSQYFSDIGRPAHDARLVLGMILLKHLTVTSDEEIVQLVRESPYMQAFCGLDSFTTGNLIDSSTLTNVRKRLGDAGFLELEKKTYKILIDRKIIKAKGLLIDATVFPENVRYPTDAGLLNEARKWLVDSIKSIGGVIKLKFRTYCRTAQKEYLDFSKKKGKTKKAVKRINKSMLQFVRRNIKQLDDILRQFHDRGLVIGSDILDRLTTIKTVYEQQFFMYSEGVKRVVDRIVSLHKPQVRPIKRGKAGKDVEFGSKSSVSHVGGFSFLDHLSTDNFNETNDVADQLDLYKERFGKSPPYAVGDRAYGTVKNRKILQEEGIRDAFEPRGRKVKHGYSDRWRQRKRRERNQIEGAFGNVKNHYGLNKIKYSIAGGDEIWVRLGLMAANLKKAVKMI
jgi:IS5 family transposase